VSVAPGFVERERELATVTTIADEAASGRGRVLLVEGPAGIGKSRVLEELRGHAQRAGTLTLTARGGDSSGQVGAGRRPPVARQRLQRRQRGPTVRRDAQHPDRGAR
jgi:ABC-type hemin transport system ATPase subunit